MKKFLKTLGIAGLVACSLFTLTACTQDETQNNSNQQMVQVKDDEAKQSVFDLLQEAETKLLLNCNSCWDGLSLGNYQYIKAQDGKYVRYYRDDSKYIIECDDFEYTKYNTGTTYVSNSGHSWLGVSGILNSVPFTFDRELSIDNLVNYEIYENAAFVYFIKDNNDNTYREYFRYEIYNGILKSITRWEGAIDSGETSYSTIPTLRSTIINYSGADRELIETKYQEAKNYIASHN